jgi:hypothetical protein
MESFISFKKELKLFLVSHAFYTVKEFITLRKTRRVELGSVTKQRKV